MKKYPGKLFVISGPSGSGKSTLTRIAIEQTGAALSVSATTRPMASGEVSGRDYYFMSREDFQQKIENNEFLEYADVFGNFYGTPAEPVIQKLAEGQTVILEIDVQGGLQVFKNFPQAQGILILPPDEQQLRLRLENRGREGQEIIEKRLEKARWEIEMAQNSDFYKNVIVNDKLDDATAELLGILRK